MGERPTIFSSLGIDPPEKTTVNTLDLKDTVKCSACEYYDYPRRWCTRLHVSITMHYADRRIRCPTYKKKVINNDQKDIPNNNAR